MIIAVDFDGTIVKHRYPEIGEPIPFAIETLKLIQKELRHTLILWTVREGELLQEAVDYCRERGLIFYAINMNEPGDDPQLGPRKLMADLFIDDRNFGGVPDWGFIYNALKESPDKIFSQEIFEGGHLEKKVKRRKFFGL